jgi:hypothetical protein
LAALRRLYFYFFNKRTDTLVLAGEKTRSSPAALRYAYTRTQHRGAVAVAVKVPQHVATAVPAARWNAETTKRRSKGPPGASKWASRNDDVDAIPLV